MNLTEYKVSQKVKALVVGQAKSGKTTGAATWPRSVIIECDPNGIAPLVKPELEKKYGFSKNVVDFKLFQEADKNNRGVVNTHNAYDDVCKYFDEWKKPENLAKFDTLIIDSGTTLGEFARNKAIILFGGTAFAKNPISFTHQQALTTGMVHTKLQDYGGERSLMEQFVDMALGLDKNVLLLAHEREEWEGSPPNEKLIGYRPMFTGQSVERIPLKFTEVWWVRSVRQGEGFKRFLQTEADGYRNCSTALGIPTGEPWEYATILKTLKERAA